jgi:hypothetical protein
VGWGRRRGRRRRNKVSAEWVYIDCYRWNHQRTRSIGIPVGEFAGDCVTSLYGDPGLNSSVIPSVKSSVKNPRHHTIATFQKKLYNPSVIRSIYTDRIGDEIMSVGKNYRRKNSVGFRRFSGSEYLLKKSHLECLF